MDAKQLENKIKKMAYNNDNSNGWVKYCDREDTIIWQRGFNEKIELCTGNDGVKKWWNVFVSGSRKATPKTKAEAIKIAKEYMRKR